MIEKSDLAREMCEPAESGMAPMSLNDAKKILPLLDPAWAINSAGHLERVFLTKNFMVSLELAVKLGAIAEKANHHPDLFVSYGKLKVEIWTEKVSGLSRADFVLAAKFDEVIGHG